MGQELADGYIALVFGGERGPVGGRRTIEIDLAAVDELLDRNGRRHHHGERCGIEDRIDGGRRSGGEHGTVAESLSQDDLVADAQHDHRAGKVPGRDLLADDGADGFHTFGWRRGGSGRRRRCGA